MARPTDASERGDPRIVRGDKEADRVSLRGAMLPALPDRARSQPAELRTSRRSCRGARQQSSGPGGVDATLLQVREADLAMCVAGTRVYGNTRRVTGAPIPGLAFAAFDQRTNNFPGTHFSAPANRHRAVE